VREPALGPRRISLLKLYKRIIAMGGYDMVSDTPMMWKKIAAEYNVPPMSNAGMPGYLLKTMYYKNLAYVHVFVMGRADIAVHSR
jgi:chromatin structure-remodeling complex subunit RSC9